jgi:hypothetical protein
MPYTLQSRYKTVKNGNGFLCGKFNSKNLSKKEYVEIRETQGGDGFIDVVKQGINILKDTPEIISAVSAIPNAFKELNKFRETENELKQLQSKKKEIKNKEDEKLKNQTTIPLERQKELEELAKLGAMSNSVGNGFTKF